MRAATALLLTLFLAGCGNAPTHFFTLATDTAGGGSGGHVCGGRPLEVQHILLPGVLDRESVVRLRDAEIVEVSGDDRWAAPLDEMIQRVVAQDLRTRLSTSQVLLPGDAAPSGGTNRVTLNIARFIGDASGEVTLQADWTLTNPAGKLLFKRTETITARAVTPKTPDVVAAMSQALGELSNRVAAVLRTCPS